MNMEQTIYKGEIYDVGNERHNLIELWYKGVFVRCVEKKELKDASVQTKIVFRKSLNGSDRTIRLRQLENECKRTQKGLFELMTYDEAIAFVNKPIDAKERLRIYRGAGLYGNNKKPRVKINPNVDC